MSRSLRYTYFILVAVILGALLPAAGCLAEREVTSVDLNDAMMPVDLTYYTEQLPPYNYVENGTLQGISYNFV